MCTGSGKTLLASRMGTILPELAPEESLQTTRIWSAVGRLDPGQPLLIQRPFRSPHHTISEAGLVGGGSIPAPGEISLAHHGVLFLDELPEFNRRTLEVLRQPLEDGHVTLTRASGSLRYPARFMLVAAMNPCPCGHLGDPRRDCRCTPGQVQRYQSRLSGPLLDRIDLQIEVSSLSQEELTRQTTAESSAQVSDRVIRARERASSRQDKSSAMLSTREIDQRCSPGTRGLEMLKQAISRVSLSARAYHRILKVARTIADLASAQSVGAAHVAEAIQYRRFERG